MQFQQEYVRQPIFMNKAKTKISEGEVLAKIAMQAMQDKKTSDIVVLDLRDISGAAFDFFVIGTGNSPSHLDAIENEIELKIKSLTGDSPYHREGQQNAQWIVLDYVNTVIHLFQKESRDYYQLESLWADAHRTDIHNNGD